MLTETTPPISAIPPLVIVGVLFFGFGFIIWLNRTLIPFLKLACELTYAQALLVMFAFYIAHVFLVLQKTGVRNGMAFGLVVMAGGADASKPTQQRHRRADSAPFPVSDLRNHEQPRQLQPGP